MPLMLRRLISYCFPIMIFVIKRSFFKEVSLIETKSIYSHRVLKYQEIMILNVVNHVIDIYQKNKCALLRITFNESVFSRWSIKDWKEGRQREREKKRERIAEQIVMKLSNIIRGDPRFIYWSSLSRNIELIAYFAMIESIGIPDSGYAEAALMVVLTRERLWDICRKYFRS